MSAFGNLTGKTHAKKAKQAADFLQRESQYQEIRALLEQYRESSATTRAALPMASPGEESSGYMMPGSMLSQAWNNMQMASLAGQARAQMLREASKAKKAAGKFKAGIAVASMVTMGIAGAMAPAAAAASGGLSAGTAGISGTGFATSAGLLAPALPAGSAAAAAGAVSAAGGAGFAGFVNSAMNANQIFNSLSNLYAPFDSTQEL